jgi:protein TonB
VSSLLMESPTSIAWPRWSQPSLRTAQAVVLTVLLHAGVLALLLANLAVPTPPAPSVKSISMQLVSLPPAAPIKPAVLPLEAPAPAPLPEISVPLEPKIEPKVEPKVDPRIEQRQLEQAALARKRVEEEKREAQRQQLERQREEQARVQQQRELQQLQAAEQQRQQAAVEQARQAEAAAASRQYLPIAKQAPTYPQRALDKGIEGECTVTYTVNAQGRVEQPEVVGACHPLFIRPSLAAAQSFRYQPRVIEGRAVAVPNVKNTFTYRIE